MEQVTPIFTFYLGSFPVNLTWDVVIQWIVIVVLGIMAHLLTRNLKRIPDKKQVILETIYNFVKNLVYENMGPEYKNYIPYVGTLVIYLIALNFLGIIGVKTPTRTVSVTFGLALTSFVVVNGNALRKNGLLGYLKGLTQPFILMLPINIMERIVLLISLTLRLFGNMMAATILIDMIYKALESIIPALPVTMIGLPIIAHGFFDLFDGTIQMLVFTMLTIINIKVTADHH